MQSADEQAKFILTRHKRLQLLHSEKARVYLLASVFFFCFVSFSENKLGCSFSSGAKRSTFCLEFAERAEESELRAAVGLYEKLSIYKTEWG